MLIKNEAVNDGLVNGVMGTVVQIPDFQEGSLPNCVFINFDNEKVGKNSNLQKFINKKRCVGIEPSIEDIALRNGIRKQYPLRLAWACTVHKVQGLTVSEAVVDLNKCFTCGQSYVALSRVSTKKGLHILEIDDNKLNTKIYCDPDIMVGITHMESFITDTFVECYERDVCTLIYHNIQGLKNHKDDLICNTDFKNANYICITETWLNSECDTVYIPGYEFNHVPRSAAYTTEDEFYVSLKEMAQGGVGIYAKQGSKYRKMKYTGKNLECVIFIIPDINLVVVTIYRTQKYQIGKFLGNLNCLIEDISKLSERMIIVGDFNQDILKEEKSVLNFMESKEFKQIVLDATTEGGTLIDHVYIRNCADVHIKILPTYYSYHDAIEIKFNINW